MLRLCPPDFGVAWFKSSTRDELAPKAVWSFSVSGYRLLPRWIEARVGLPADLALVRDLRDICWRVAELIDLFAEADIVLQATLHETLIREALGLAPAGQDANDGTD
jgi:hypothetical protein